MHHGRVTYNDERHAPNRLAPRPNCRKKKKHNGNGDGRKCESKLRVAANVAPAMRENDHKLDSKGEEEKEVEFEEGDVDLADSWLATDLLYV